MKKKWEVGGGGGGGGVKESSFKKCFVLKGQESLHGVFANQY